MHNLLYTFIPPDALARILCLRRYLCIRHMRRDISRRALTILDWAAEITRASSMHAMTPHICRLVINAINLKLEPVSPWIWDDIATDFDYT